MKKIFLFILSIIIISFFGCKSSGTQSPNYKKDNNNIVKNVSEYNEHNPLNIKNFDMNCSGITEDKDFIYYCSEEGINKVDKRNGESKVIFKQQDVSDLVLDNKHLYFLTEGGENFKIFRVDLNGENYFQVFDGKEI